MCGAAPCVGLPHPSVGLPHVWGCPTQVWGCPKCGAAPPKCGAAPCVGHMGMWACGLGWGSPMCGAMWAATCVGHMGMWLPTLPHVWGMWACGCPHATCPTCQCGACDTYGAIWGIATHVGHMWHKRHEATGISPTANGMRPLASVQPHQFAPRMRCGIVWTNRVLSGFLTGVCVCVCVCARVCVHACVLLACGGGWGGVWPCAGSDGEHERHRCPASRYSLWFSPPPPQSRQERWRAMPTSMRVKPTS
jgi:hypothetical protein